MGKGSNVQKKQAARARHEKEANKAQGGGGLAGKASRTGANVPFLNNTDGIPAWDNMDGQML